MLKRLKKFPKIIIEYFIKMYFIVILKNIFNLSNTQKFFIIQVLEILETFSKIIPKHILKLCLIVILGNVSNIFNT